MTKKYNFSVTEVARKLGVKPVTIYNRILWGWPVEKAISTPPTRKNKRQIVTENPYNKRKYKSCDEAKIMHNIKVFEDEMILKKHETVVDFSPLGGWQITILNRPKCREYKFQAYNTVTGEFLKSNNSEEIKRLMYKIFAYL